MGAASITLCMIVKDEARYLARCLDSVGDVAAQIVIIDTGSTDATPEIATSYGALPARFDFAVVDFAAARNQALARAKCHWILTMDADEILDPASVPLIRALARRGENAGYYFQRLNRHGNSEDATTDYVVRLFPNRPAYRYRGRVHETVDAAILAGGGRLLRTSIRIEHDFASDPDARRRKNLLYIEILTQELAADPNDCSRLDFLAAEYHQLGMFDEAAAIAERIARLQPLDPQAYLRAGSYHLLYQTDRERARAYFTEALRLRPEYPEARWFLQQIEEQDRAVSTTVLAPA
jgi:glycosyltransferase involved in cell wall biosynthesis